MSSFFKIWFRISNPISITRFWIISILVAVLGGIRFGQVWLIQLDPKGEESAGEEAPKRSCRGRPRTDLTNVCTKVLSSQPWFSGLYSMVPISYGFHMVSWFHNILNLFCIILHFCRCYRCFLVFTASLNRLRTQRKLPMKQCPKSLLMGSV